MFVFFVSERARVVVVSCLEWAFCQSNVAVELLKKAVACCRKLKLFFIYYFLSLSFIKYILLYLGVVAVSFCHCRSKSGCPLDGRCLTASIVYRAEITPTDTQESKVYIGITAGPFNEPYNNHKKSLTSAKYTKETELSRYAWNLKENGRSFSIKWSIIKRVPAYTAGGRSCDLCLEEKIFILKSNKGKTLNKR